MDIRTTKLSLLRLMQLSSVSLPVGAYSFSQGLEYAIESGWVTSAEKTTDWIRVVMHRSMTATDLPLLVRLLSTIKRGDVDSVIYWNAMVLACRETDELVLTETAMGEAIFRLLHQLKIPSPITIPDDEQSTFILGFALAANHWQIDSTMALVGYLWSWLENQIAAATKLVPLGQSTAQQLLIDLGDEVDPVVNAAIEITDKQIGASLPGLTMASAWHETQYSRLFRS